MSEGQNGCQMILEDTDWTLAIDESSGALSLVIIRLDVVRFFHNHTRRLLSSFETIHKASGRQRTGL
jgi:hypothetical protein